jgi:hypothetical protein
MYHIHDDDSIIFIFYISGQSILDKSTLCSSSAFTAVMLALAIMPLQVLLKFSYEP